MNILLRLRRQSTASMRRFTMPSIFSLLLFFDLSFWTCSETDSQKPAYAALALSIALLFSIWWQLFLEIHPIRRVPAWLQQSLSIFVCLGAYGLFAAVQPMSYAVLYAAGMMAALTAWILFWLTRHTGESSFNRLFCGALQAAGVAVIAHISLSTCVLALQLLLHVVIPAADVYAVIVYFSFLVIGVNVLLSAFPGQGETAVPSRPLGSVMAYVILPMYCILLGILYVYIVMIFLRGEMPVGQMNWFASLALLVYAFCYLTCSDYDRHAWLRRYRRWGGLLLLPVVAVQLWGVHIRYEAYGLTALRYLSMACTAFGIAVILAGLRRLSGAWLFLLAAVMALAVSVTPLNILDVPYRNQETRLLSLLEEKGMLENGTVSAAADLSNEDKEQIYSAYRYVAQHEGRHDPAVEQVLQSPVMESLRHHGPHARSRYFTNAVQAMPVSGYTMMYLVEQTAGEDGLITISTGRGDVELSLRPYAEQLCRQYDSAEPVAGSHAENLYVIPDDRHYLYIHTMNVDLAGNTVQHISISAVLLEK